MLTRKLNENLSPNPNHHTGDFLNFLYKHARWLAFIQVASVVGLGISSVWYGAWFPDAQAALQQQRSVEAGNKPVEKPDFWDVTTQNFTLRTPVVLTLVSLVMAVVGGVGSVAAASRLSALEVREHEFDQEQEDHSETRRYYYDSLQDHLVNLFVSKLTCFDDTCRASVYRFDSESNLLRMVFRYAPVNRYHSKGRVAFPVSEGFAGAAWAAADHLSASFKEKPGSPKYCREINNFLKVYGASIEQGVIARLRMKSCCYFGYSIRDVNSGQKFAILILESVKADQLNPAEILQAFPGQANQMAKYVKHMVALDSLLNPFGKAA